MFFPVRGLILCLYSFHLHYYDIFDMAEQIENEMTAEIKDAIMSRQRMATHCRH